MQKVIRWMRATRDGGGAGEALITFKRVIRQRPPEFFYERDLEDRARRASRRWMMTADDGLRRCWMPPGEGDAQRVTLSEKVPQVLGAAVRTSRT